MLDTVVPGITGEHVPPRDPGALADVLAFSPDGRRLITAAGGTLFAPETRSIIADGDRAVVVRDARTLRPLRRFPVSGTAAAVSPDGRLAALGAGDGSVRLLDLRSGALRTAAGRHDGRVNAIVFAPDSRTLVTSGADGRAIVWDAAHATLVERLAGHAGPVSQTAIAPDGRTAFSASDDGSVIAWDLRGTRRLGRPFDAGAGNPGRASLAVAPRGSAFAVPERDGYVRLFDARSLASLARIRVGGGAVTAVAIAPDGRTLVTGSADRTLKLWSIPD
jgi:WD40 repeat protein